MNFRRGTSADARASARGRNNDKRKRLRETKIEHERLRSVKERE